MDWLKKVETLLNATARAGLPRRRRRSPLDERDENLLAEIRQALASVELREREMAGRLKLEQAQAEEAARRGDRAGQQAHERRAAELERHLEQESIQAINLEEKLAALEEKLALAKAEVDKQARAAAIEDEKQSRAMAMTHDGEVAEKPQAAPDERDRKPVIKEEFADDEPDIAARKSRLSD